MHRRFHLLLILLLCSGCIPQPAKVTEQSVVPPEPSIMVRMDEQHRKLFRLGLEALAQQQTVHLEQLMNEAPDTVWGTAARQILHLHGRLLETDSELRELRKTTKSLSKRQTQLQTENRELKNKLDELTRLLVELEKRHH